MRAYKTELLCSNEQKQKMAKSMGVCRFLYNSFIGYNQELYQKGEKFCGGMSYDKYANHTLSVEKPWIKEISSKARKKAIMNADTAFQKFFKGKAKYPRFKKKNRQDIGIYFPKNNKTDLTVERHRIKVPTMGWIRLKEKAYIPPGAHVSSVTITQKGDRYFISALVKEEAQTTPATPFADGIGIDLGLKNFAITSDGRVFKNINKSPRIKRLEKKLRREQRSLSRKFEHYKKLKQTKLEENPTENQRKNVRKNITRVQNLHRRLTNIRNAYQNYVIREVVKTKPLYITLEKLNVKGMMKNKHLSKAISKQKFYEFKLKLIQKCSFIGTEIREVGTFYPSSKLCSCCGVKKVKLSLSERVFNCDHCGASLDRDDNASLNLSKATEYTILT
ncbi:transposase [Priestia filamentosa]|uniref:RNA-guided endonuclease InsQ/TnpB family protein n=1 Tax=Priestia filamentosa TaxID=1402861 RepID=UPI00397A3E6F